MANVIAPPPGMNLTPDQVTDALWNHHCRSFQSGATREIVLDLGWKIHLGQNGVDELAKRMSLVIESPVTTFESQQVNRLIIMPASTDLGHTVEVFQTQIAANLGKNQKVARPPNAFILFRKHYHPRYKAADPDMHNNEISKSLGEAWNMAPDSTKNHFRKLAEEAKIKHMADHPNYVYQPRKAHEKKRRMTRRKREALGAESVVDADLNLTKNRYGNVILEFGAENEDEHLRAKLKEHNRLTTQNPSHRDKFINQMMPAAIHAEPTQDWQNELNFYSGLFGDHCNHFPDSSDFALQRPAASSGFSIAQTVNLQEVEMKRMDCFN